MTKLPDRYLYIVDLDTGEPLVVLPVDHLADECEVDRLAEDLRRTHRIDDADTRLVLKDSRAERLDDHVLKTKLHGG